MGEIAASRTNRAAYPNLDAWVRRFQTRPAYQDARCWALELAPLGVRVNAIAAGPTESGALTGMMGLSPEQAEAVKERERERIPLKRRGHPNDVARWIVSLADPASEWVTGQVIAVDGGWDSHKRWLEGRNARRRALAR